MQTLNGIDSKFRLAILVARRAKQLIAGARKKVEIKSENPLSVAMEEFRQGKINFDILNQEDTIFQMESAEAEAAARALASMSGENEGDGEMGAEEEVEAASES